MVFPKIPNWSVLLYSPHTPCLYFWGDITSTYVHPSPLQFSDPVLPNMRWLIEGSGMGWKRFFSCCMHTILFLIKNRLLTEHRTSSYGFTCKSMVLIDFCLFSAHFCIRYVWGNKIIISCTCTGYSIRLGLVYFRLKV